jgi:hypothetical protein
MGSSHDKHSKGGKDDPLVLKGDVEVLRELLKEAKDALDESNDYANDRTHMDLAKRIGKILSE